MFGMMAFMLATTLTSSVTDLAFVVVENKAD